MNVQEKIFKSFKRNILWLTIFLYTCGAITIFSGMFLSDYNERLYTDLGLLTMFMALTYGTGIIKMMNNKLDIIQLIGYAAIAVIMYSLINIGMNLTGKVTDTGVINITIESTASINFTTDFIDFGSGQVDAGQSSATIDTISVSSNGNWTSPASNFVIENIGNVNVSLNLSFGKTAAQFLGGTSPSYKYNFTNVEYRVVVFWVTVLD